VDHLIEYKKYKMLLQTFAELEEKRAHLYERGNVFEELKIIGERNNVEAELQDLDLYKLLKVYIKIMERYELEKNKPVHTVVPYPYTIESQKLYILNRVQVRKKLSFKDILEDMPDKIALIFNFLSILELLQLRQISIRIGEGYNNFWIEATSDSQA